jgi:hypothetical protein
MHGPTPRGIDRCSRSVVGLNHARLDALVEEATVDCYDDDEQVTGLSTMIADNLSMPFPTRVLGVDVTVTDLELRGRYDIVAICRRDEHAQAISLLELPLPTPPPDGSHWIEAYRHWTC